ncbi:MAG: S-methyl-5-thioribose-1-phosphate isomerase [Oscillospiraceae bacterium]|nr:S-methyl-5-thioribose-1-phosphate isomerase [Oscillospiraceae bacterium]
MQKLDNVSVQRVENIRLSDDETSIIIIDQTLLPNETKHISLNTAAELHEAIASLKIRGAPAIGIFAAYALYILALQHKNDDYQSFLLEIKQKSAYLGAARPTAVNLTKQLGRIEKLVESLAGSSKKTILDAMRNEADSIQREDIAMCLSISEHGLSLIRDGFGIMTYCNAGPLATSRYGTGLGPILLARERGISLNVYCCETRPLLQGARLTTFELNSAGIDCTLICDNMASSVMSDGKIDAVFVGCDRIARNGDIANKIGTSGVAILAKHYGIPFYVCCPSSTIDHDCATGADIEIELRSPDEIKELYFEKPVAPADVKCYNPAFDITASNLITAIITEKGIHRAPYDFSL